MTRDELKVSESFRANTVRLAGAHSFPARCQYTCVQAMEKRLHTTEKRDMEKEEELRSITEVGARTDVAHGSVVHIQVHV